MSLYQDARFGLRTMARTPVATAVAVITLALGIGANTAIFSVVSGILLEPLPYAEPGELVVGVAVENAGFTYANSPANFLDWREQSTRVEQLTAARMWSPTLTGQETPYAFRGLLASAGMFDLIGARAALGRTFNEQEHGVAGEHRVAVLSHGAWQRLFAGDHGVLGQSIRLDGEAHTVLGVMPAGFEFPPFWADATEVWAPLVFDAEGATSNDSANRGARYLRIFGRLAAGAGIEQAREEAREIGRRLAADFPDDNEGSGLDLEPLHEPVVSDVRPALIVLLATVTFVLLIACANVANLLLARGAARRREVAVRVALGAGRGRLLRQFLVESLLLASLGGAAGIVLAWAGVRLLTRLAPADLPRLDAIGIDPRVILFTIGLTLLTGLLFGLAPALRASRPDIKAFAGGPQRLLIVAEVALALVLLVGTGLMTNSLFRLTRVDPGFDPRGLMTLRLSFGDPRYEEGTTLQPVLDRIVEGVGGSPGITSAALVNFPHLGGDLWGIGITAQLDDSDQGLSAMSERISISPRVVTPGFFATMETPLLDGRDFDPRDDAGGAPVVVINERLARALFPGGRVVGRRIKRGDPDSDSPWMTVVGVVGDIHQNSLAESIRPEVYFPYAQNPFSWFPLSTVVARSSLPPHLVAEAVQAAVWSVDRDIPIGEVLTADRVVSHTMASSKMNAVLLAIFSAVALLLAVVGIYGVISYSVSRRVREIGIRVALGARPGEILRMVFAQGLGLTLAGLATGLVLALGVTRFMTSLLFEVSPTDPLTYGAIVIVLLGAAGAACYLPARRATRVDPMTALRTE